MNYNILYLFVCVHNAHAGGRTDDNDDDLAAEKGDSGEARRMSPPRLRHTHIYPQRRYCTEYGPLTTLLFLHFFIKSWGASPPNPPGLAALEKISLFGTTTPERPASTAVAPGGPAERHQRPLQYYIYCKYCIALDGLRIVATNGQRRTSERLEAQARPRDITGQNGIEHNSTVQCLRQEIPVF
jgi:hypothetical protein